MLESPKTNTKAIKTNEQYFKRVIQSWENMTVMITLRFIGNVIPNRFLISKIKSQSLTTFRKY